MTTAIGNQIKRKREEEGKSQRKMAEELGVAQSALSQLENGKPASRNCAACPSPPCRPRRAAHGRDRDNSSIAGCPASR